MFGAGAAQRLVLLLNHLLASEPAAAARLAPHAGRRIQVQAAGAPAWLPLPPPLMLRITPIGWLETVDGALADAGDPALALTLDLSDPMRAAADWLAGDRSAIAVDGSDAFAADMRWLLDHLRWDLEDDLQRGLGPVVAGGIAAGGARVAAVAGAALGALASRRPTRR